jgi:hypothetical protein
LKKCEYRKLVLNTDKENAEIAAKLQEQEAQRLQAELHNTKTALGFLISFLALIIIAVGVAVWKIKNNSGGLRGMNMRGLIES